MNRVMEYRGYHAKFDFSAEDETFVGRILGINDTIVFDGNTVEELKQTFHESIDDYLELCQEIGKEPDREYKGTFNVRIPSELHKRATIEAEALGISLNQFIQQSIEHELSGFNVKWPITIITDFPFQLYNNENISSFQKFGSEEVLKTCHRTIKLQSFVS